jgi:hypothetical protein
MTGESSGFTVSASGFVASISITVCGIANSNARYNNTCMIVALAGRRIDSPEAETTSFPLSNLNRVRNDLHDLFARLQPFALVSSAACGADLLALDEAGKLGIRRRVILPFDSEQFLKSSVIDRPGEWRLIYQRIVDELAASRELLVIGTDLDRDAAYSLVNSVILAQARDLANYFDLPMTAVLVWDGKPRGPSDLTETFRFEAARKGFQITEIQTN